MKGRLALGTALAALALVAAGCGGGSDQTATESWADALCTSVNSWADSIDSAKTTLSDTGSLSADTVKNTIGDVRDATQTLADNVSNLGPPDTEAGTEAQQQLSDLSDTVDAQEQVISDAFDTAGGSFTALLTQVTAITGALTTVGNAVKTAYDNIRALNGADELRQAFSSQKSCDEAQQTLGSLG